MKVLRRSISCWGLYEQDHPVQGCVGGPQMCLLAHFVPRGTVQWPLLTDRHPASMHLQVQCPKEASTLGAFIAPGEWLGAGACWSSDELCHDDSLSHNKVTLNHPWWARRLRLCRGNAQLLPHMGTGVRRAVWDPKGLVVSNGSSTATSSQHGHQCASTPTPTAIVYKLFARHLTGLINHSDNSKKSSMDGAHTTATSTTEEVSLWQTKVFGQQPIQIRCCDCPLCNRHWVSELLFSSDAAAMVMPH